MRHIRIYILYIQLVRQTCNRFILTHINPPDNYELQSNNIHDVMVKHKFEFFKNSGKEYILFDCSDQYWAISIYSKKTTLTKTTTIVRARTKKSHVRINKKLVL